MPTSRNASTGSDTSIELIGIDDGPFKGARTPVNRKDKGLAPLVVVQLNGPHIVRVRTGRVTVDGLDATGVALRLLRSFPQRIPVLMAGATYGGFNVMDPRVIKRRQDAPVIVVIGAKPGSQRVKQALVRHFTDWQKRWRLLGSLGPARAVRTSREEAPIFYENFGCSPREASIILSRAALVSRLPEPIRVASTLARGLFAQDFVE